VRPLLWQWTGAYALSEMQNERTAQRYIIAKRDEKILDTEWVSRFFGMSHLDVRADRTQNWKTQQIWIVSKIQLQIYTQCRWPARKLLKEEDPKYGSKCMALFYDGISADSAGVWDAIENPVEILRWDNPDMYSGGNERMKLTNSLTTGVCWTDKLQTRRKATSE
jgi:hypothetical protein